MKVLDIGNHLVALAARAAGVEVVPAYPITPQTQVIEKIASLIDEGKMDAEYIPVESEHSAAAALIAASMVGVRAFSATAAHGLAYMHEMLHYAAGIRAPVVMANINRALGPGWNIWCDHQDSISQRDTGWLQMYCSSHQETVDTIIQAFRITEDRSVLLPMMVNIDAFVLSHTLMAAEVPEPEEVKRFLPSYSPRWTFDPRDPVTHGSVIYPDDFSETRESMALGQQNAREVIRKAAREYREIFGRYHGDLVEDYRCEGAEHLVIAMGTLASETRVAIDAAREEGLPVGLLRIRSLRPFPVEEITRYGSGRRSILVIDRDYSYGIGGAVFTEVRSVLYGKADARLQNFIIGLGGRDVNYRLILEMIRDVISGREKREVIWGDSHVSSGHLVTLKKLREIAESKE